MVSRSSYRGCQRSSGNFSIQGRRQEIAYNMELKVPKDFAIHCGMDHLWYLLTSDQYLGAIQEAQDHQGAYSSLLDRSDSSIRENPELLPYRECQSHHQRIDGSIMVVIVIDS